MAHADSLSLLVCLCLSVLVISGCVGKNDRTPAASGEEPAGSPADLSVLIGRKGEMAGRQSGFRFAEGMVSRWEGKFPGERVLAEAPLQSADMDSLWLLLSDFDFFGKSLKEMGDQTRFIETRTGALTRRIEWKLPVGDESEHEDLDLLFEQCRAIALAALEG